LKLFSRIERELIRKDGACSCTFKTQERIYLELKFLKLIAMNPKGGELLLSMAKSEETPMEASTHSNAQIDVKT
jgi:hypothetical protein